jgi:hypothetical protein
MAGVLSAISAAPTKESGARRFNVEAMNVILA